MLSKKLNDPFYWKNKLETINSLSGEVVADKDILWEKMQGRLQQKSTAGKARWYWIAACLLPVMIITVTMLSKTNDILIKHEPVPENNTKETTLYVKPAAAEVVTLSTSAPIDKKHPAVINAKAIKEIFADTIKASETMVTILPVQTETAITTNYEQPVDTVVTITATAVAKKKLRVVHINELETYPREFTEPVSYAQHIKQRKSKINTQNIVTQQNTIGFKIKLSSKN